MQGLMLVKQSKYKDGLKFGIQINKERINFFRMFVIYFIEFHLVILLTTDSGGMKATCP